MGGGRVGSTNLLFDHALLLAVWAALFDHQPATSVPMGAPGLVGVFATPAHPKASSHAKRTRRAAPWASQGHLLPTTGIGRAAKYAHPGPGKPAWVVFCST